MTVAKNDSAQWRAFDDVAITHSAAHYLMTIMNVRRQQGYVRVTDVAERLEISKGAASKAIMMLKNRGWIQEDANRMLELTDRGMQLARSVERNYLVIECFLEDILGLSAKTAREDACKIEHLLSLQTIQGLLRLIHILGKNREKLNWLGEELSAYTPVCDDEGSCLACVDHDKCIIAEAIEDLDRL